MADVGLEYIKNHLRNEKLSPLQESALAAAVRAIVEPGILVRVTCKSLGEFERTAREVIVGLGSHYDFAKTKLGNERRLAGAGGHATIEVKNGSGIQFAVCPRPDSNRHGPA